VLSCVRALARCSVSVFKPQTLPCLVVPAAGRLLRGWKRDIYYPIASERLASGLQEALHH
jgi:hypothetical protein